MVPRRKRIYRFYLDFTSVQAKLVAVTDMTAHDDALTITVDAFSRAVASGVYRCGGTSLQATRRLVDSPDTTGDDLRVEAVDEQRREA